MPRNFSRVMSTRRYMGKSRRIIVQTCRIKPGIARIISSNYLDTPLGIEWESFYLFFFDC
jgi:hypothetical protein